MPNTIKKLYLGAPLIVNPPEKIETLGTQYGSGGSLDTGKRHYFKLAWVTASGETLLNTGAYGYILPAAANRYTLNIPAFPSGVTSANVYACRFPNENNTINAIHDTPETALYYLQGNTATTSFIFANYLTATKAPVVDTSGLYNTVVYTVPASTKTIVKNIVLCNTGYLPSKVTLAIRPSGTALGLLLTNRIISEYLVKPYETVPIELSTVLEAGESLLMSQAVIKDTSNVTRITAHISGVEVV